MLHELAWAAGLFEGEGTITVIRRDARPRLAVKMIDEQAVRRFGDAVGIGKVYGPYGPYASQLGRTPTFYWMADGANALAVARLLRPWLGPRCRTRLTEVFGKAVAAD